MGKFTSILCCSPVEVPNKNDDGILSGEKLAAY